MRTGRSIRASPNTWTGKPASRQRQRPVIRAGPAVICPSLLPSLSQFFKRSIRTESHTFHMMTGSLQNRNETAVTSAICWITCAVNRGEAGSRREGVRSNAPLHLSECTRRYAFRLSERVSKIVSVSKSAPVCNLCDRDNFSSRKSTSDGRG